MKVQDFLADKRIPFQTHEHLPAFTAQEVAAEEHVSGYNVAKTVVVAAGQRHILCVLAAAHKLDMEKVALATGADHVRLADETEMARLFPDTEVGAEPPFGNLYQLPTYVDERLAEAPEIVFPAGSHRQTIRMSFADYEELVQPVVADLAVRL
jgi:Ala-tRNA(Pro) deacylase